MKKFSTLFVILFILVTGCGDDDSTTPFSPDDARQSLTTMSSNLSTDIVELTNAEGVDAVGDLINLLSLNDPFAGRLDAHEASKNWFKKNARLFKSLFVSKSVGFGKTEAGGFDFEGHWGIYDWNPATEQFDFSSSNDQMIIINFPAKGSSENNATLRLTDYSEQFIDDGFEGYYVPTVLSADLAINGTVQIALDFTAQYNANGTP
ncbi:MAG: hypothetical protein R3345_14395, partial [Fulvivirga sp.]|nr:hypothetical protein [Fulvivirga sp.]